MNGTWDFSGQALEDLSDTAKALGRRVVSLGRGVIDASRWLKGKICEKLDATRRALIFLLDKGAEKPEEEERRRRRLAVDCARRVLGGDPVRALRTMPPDQRIKALADLQEKLADQFNFPASKVVQSEGLGGSSGAYSLEKHCIFIDQEEVLRQPMSDEDAMEVLDTLFHEFYHSYQHVAITHPSRYGVGKSQAVEWRENFQGYISFFVDPEGYWDQPVEKSARAFSHTVVRALIGEED